MKKFFTKFLMLFFFCTSIFAQVNFDSKTYAKVNSSVFEVIVEKHEGDNIKYEKPLPLDRLPFAVRNDKYIPIGTAFLLEDGSFWTAAHVINLRGRSVYDKYFIRDIDGKVFAIKDVLKFSTNRDFICFTVADYNFVKGNGLKTTDKLDVNNTVYSVGNALGEGIIIRNGTYTSSTFEEQNGDWKWIRFSAAASPGNSGGPLLNEKAEVVGIITMKSQNENLNYALPIKEALNAPASGQVDRRYHYIMPNISSQKFYHELKETVKLPKPLADVLKEMAQLTYDDSKKTVENIRKDFGPAGEKGFFSGSSGAEILFSIPNSSFPLTIYQKETGDWDFGQQKTKEVKLDENGYVYYGAMAGLEFFRLRPPDSVTLEQLYSNPKLITEYCIKASNLSRTVVNEQIHIESLGDSVESRKYVDYWGRTWMVDYYNLDFADATLVTYSHILPTGVFVIMKTSTTAAIYATDYLDIEFIADHTHMRYGGKIKFWKQYNSLPEEFESLKSPEEKLMKVKVAAKELSVEGGAINFTVEKSKFAFDDDTHITFVQGYEAVDKKNVLKARQIIASTDDQKKDYKYISISKVNKPSESAPEDYFSTWNQILTGVEPFDGKPYTQEANTYCNTIVLPAGVSESQRNSADCVYLTNIEVAGQDKKKDAKNFIQYLIKKMSVK